MNTTLLPCPLLINGEWRTPSGLGASPVYNPSTGDVIAECPVGGKAEVEAMLREDRGAAMTCGFCNETYRLSEEDLKEILSSLEEA